MTTITRDAKIRTILSDCKYREYLQQEKVSKLFRKKHPEWAGNVYNALAFQDFFKANQLEWNIHNLNACYEILKLRKFKFSKDTD